MSDNTVFKTELEERINKINEQIESYLLLRHYDGLMKSGRIKGRH